MQIKYLFLAPWCYCVSFKKFSTVIINKLQLLLFSLKQRLISIDYNFSYNSLQSVSIAIQLIQLSMSRKRRCDKEEDDGNERINYCEYSQTQEGWDETSSIHDSESDAFEDDFCPEPEEEMQEFDTSESKDNYNTHWTEPEKDENGKYIMNQIHQTFIEATTFRERGIGPNRKNLTTSFTTFPKWIRSVSSSYTDDKYIKDGYLAPMHLFWLFMEKLKILDLVPRWSNKRMEQLFEDEKHSKAKARWMNLDKYGLVCVCLVMLLMGLYVLPSLDDYWSDGAGIKNIYEIIGKEKFKM